MRLTESLKHRLQEAFPPQSLRARLATGAFWTLVGTGISQGLALVTSVVTARLLGKVGFGELGMILSTVGMFGVFAGLGLGLTATKHVAEFRTNAPVRAGRIIGISNLVAILSGGAISTALFFLAPYLAVRTINAPHLVRELQIGSGLLFFNALGGVQVGALSGLEAFNTIAKVNLCRGLLTFPLLIAGVYWWRLPGAVAAQVLAAMVGWWISHVALQREAYKADILVSYRGLRSELPILWKFSVPAVLSASMVGPVRWVANALLVNQPNGYAEMGVFQAATRFQTLMNLAGRTLGAVALPILASADGAASERFNRANILLSWVLGVAVALPLISFPEILGVVYGAEFTGTNASGVLVMVMFFSCIMSYRQGLARVLAARSLMWWGFFDNSVWSVLLIGSFLGLARWGAMGLAVAFTIAYTLNTIVFVPLYTRRNLVPKATIVSTEAIIVWSTIIGLCLIALLNYSLVVRALCFALGVLVLASTFMRLFRSGEKL